MATKKKKHGGSRPNSGAKKKTDPKQPVFIYVPKSIVDEHGGREALKAKVEADLGC